MKKDLLFAATAAMMLASCSSEVDFTQQDLQQANAENAATPVQFGTYIANGNATRATGGQTGGMTTKTLQESTAGFGVIAYVKGTDGATDCYTSSTWNTSTPNFMYNEKVTYSTDHWTYTPVKFWPNDFAEKDDVDNKEPTGETTEAIGSVSAGKVSFFAYAPYVAPANYTTKSNDHKLNSTDNTAFDIDNSGAVTDGIVAITANDYDGEPQVKYVLSSADLASSVDLLWGIRKKGTTYNKADNTTDDQAASADMYNTDLTKQKVGETVQFFFKHALAKIGGNFYEEHGSDPATKNSGLQIVLDLDNGSQDGSVTTGTAITGGVKEDVTLVTVSDIKIEDLKTYSTRTSVTKYGTTSNLIKSGWFNIAKGTWSETTETGATYNQNVTKTSTVTGSGAVGYALNEAIKEGTVTYDSGWKIDGTSRTGVTTTPQNVYTDDSNAPALLLIPGSTDQNIVVTITYTVRTYDPKLATKNTEVTQTITNAVKIPASALDPNKYYKLLIHLGLTSVKFSATVSDWSIPGDTDGNGTIDGSETEEKKEIWLPSNTLGS